MPCDERVETERFTSFNDDERAAALEEFAAVADALEASAGQARIQSDPTMS